jgi:hypothetical protein
LDDFFGSHGGIESGQGLGVSQRRSGDGLFLANS